MREYRIIETYGHHNNKRWELQRKYCYYENGKKIESWKLVFCCGDKNKCLEALERHKNTPSKNYRVPAEMILAW